MGRPQLIQQCSLARVVQTDHHEPHLGPPKVVEQGVKEPT